MAWFKKCHFQVTPKIDKALVVKGFLVWLLSGSGVVIWVVRLASI